MRLLVTRPEPDAAATVAKLIARGHEALAAPAMAIVFPALDLPAATEISALAVTSRHAIAALSDFANDLPVYCVGEATAAAARAAGFADIRTAHGDAAALVEAIAADAPFKRPILYAAGADTARDLAGELRARGIAVHQITAYAAEPVRVLDDRPRHLLAAGAVDGILFYSARTARLFGALVHKSVPAVLPFAGTAFCLSEAVAVTARQAGFPNAVAAEMPNEGALLTAIDESRAD